MVPQSFVFDIHVFAETPDNEKALQFADYIVDTNIDQPAVFPPHIWADPDIDSKRTTNGCESFHNQFGDMFYHSDPSSFSQKRKYIYRANGRGTLRNNAISEIVEK